MRTSLSQSSLASNPLARTVGGKGRNRTAHGSDRSGGPGGVGRGSRRGTRRGPRLSPLEAAPVPQMLGWDQLDRLASQLGVTPMGKASPDIEASTQGGISMGRPDTVGISSVPGSAPGSARAAGASMYSGSAAHPGGLPNASRDVELKLRIMVRLLLVLLSRGLPSCFSSPCPSLPRCRF